MRCSTSELAEHLGGELIGPDVSIEGASVDSRTIRPGQLYAPIVAERDGRAVVWGPHRDRGRGTGGEPGLALAHGAPSRGRRPRPGRRLFQRDPRVGRGGPALAGRVAGRTQAGSPRADGRAGGTRASPSIAGSPSWR